MSSTDLNPYTPPAEIPSPPNLSTASPGFFYFRDGKFLVVRDGAELPEVCLRTNEATSGHGWRKKMPIVWTPPWVISLFIVGSPILYAIVALATQKKAKYTYSLSQATRSKIIRRKIIGAVLFLTAVSLIIMGAFLDDQNFIIGCILGGIVLIFVSLIPMTLANPFRVSGYQNGWFKIKGCSPDFLDSISGPADGF